MKIFIFQKIKAFLMISSVTLNTLFFSTPAFAQTNKCENIFNSEENRIENRPTSIPHRRPDVGQFLKSSFFKETLRSISAKLPNDQLRLLKINFNDNSKLGSKGAFVLFLLLWPSVGFSQQSLFNVPSSEPTEKDKFFFQEQINIIPQEAISNSTLDYGLGQGWSAGVSLFNLKGYTKGTNYIDPEVLGNLEKSYNVTPNWRVGVGTQAGFNTGNNPDHLTQFESFSYLQNVFILPDEAAKFYGGYYHANSGFTGGNSSDGAMLGVEVPILKDKLTFMADYLTGTSPISVAVAGLVWATENKTQISAGVQIPSPGSDNDYGLVMELTAPSL